MKFRLFVAYVHTYFILIAIHSSLLLLNLQNMLLCVVNENDVFQLGQAECQALKSVGLKRSNIDSKSLVYVTNGQFSLSVSWSISTMFLASRKVLFKLT